MPVQAYIKLAKTRNVMRSGIRWFRPTLAAMVFSFAWLIALAVPSARAQDTNDPLSSLGIPPFTGFIPVQNGRVNVSNGDLHLEFPIVSLPQRGKSPLTVTLAYDSNIWYGEALYGMYPSYGNVGAFGSGTASGWNIYQTQDPGSVVKTWNVPFVCKTDGMDDYDQFSDWTWTSPEGTTHEFNVLTVEGFVNQCGDYTSYNVPSGDSLAIDGSGYHLYVTNYTGAIVYAPDGTIVYGAKDSNGNYFPTDYTVSHQTTIVDTLGRNSVTTSTNGMTTTLTVPNAGKGGGVSNYVLTFETINVCTNFPEFNWCCVTGCTTAISVIKSIQLPDGTSYSFTYDSGTTPGNYGQLTSMTLPTHGTIYYSYANFTDSEYKLRAFSAHYTRGLSTMTTPDGEWTFTPAVIHQCTGYGGGCQQQLTVTKPSYNGRSDTAVYKTYIDGTMFPVEADYYNGSVSASNLLATLTQSFDFSHGCPGNGLPNQTLCGLYQSTAYVTKLSETLTLPTSSGTNINRTTQYCYDINYGNLLYKWEWNFYSGAAIHNPNPPSSCSVYSGVPSPDRTTTYAYVNGSTYLAKNIYNRPSSVTVTNSSGSAVALTKYSYDGSTLVSGAVGSCPAVTGSTGHDDVNYGTGNTVRGNVTQIQRLISGSNYLSTSQTYDITGQVRTSTDSNGNTTTYCYADNFFTDGGDSSNPAAYTPSKPTNAYLTTTTHPTVNSVTLIDTFGYYWGSGLKALSIDPNGTTATTYYHFYDSMNRPTSTIPPPVNGGSNKGWTYKVYPSASETQIDTGTGITSTSLSISCTGSAGDCRHDTALLDNMGRISSQILVSDPDGQTTVGTSYDSNGRVYSVTNPYRSGSSPTDGTEYYAYDGLGRKIQVTKPDGSIEHVYFGAAVSSSGGRSSQLCSGIGYPVLTTDEASKLRQAWTDGFGRLIEVDEPDPSTGSLTSGSYAGTCYAYDLNNNLTGVTQGSQTRSFSYDMLSRITKATNPESGTICYYYTTSGGTCGVPAAGTPCSGELTDVCRRTDARSKTTTYVYDALNRLVSKSYSDTTPGVKYGYDAVPPSGCTPPTLTITYGLGRRTSMCDGPGATAWAYDAVGNALTEKRTTNSVTNSFTYTYNLDNSVATLTYPSGRTMTYAPGGAQRPFSAKDLSNSINYATSAHYMPPGELASLTNGGSIFLTTLTNPRLQPCWQYATTGTALSWSGTPCNGSATAGNIIDLKYTYNLGSSDNGNVIGITNNRDTTRSESFTYDSLNRIATGAASTFATSPSHCWGESYTIDRYGNMTGIGAISSSYNGCAQDSLSLSVSTSSNQITSSGFTYDASGNLTSDGTHSPTYDAESQMISNSGVTYSYDGDGKRVQKSSGTLYWYGTSPDPLLETTGGGSLINEYIFFGGKRISRRDSSNNIEYYFADEIGSSRVVTNASGTIAEDCDYFPYGRSSCAPSSVNNYLFSGKERDAESGLDDFGARYYSSQYGRFMIPDWAAKATAVPYADFGNPQSLNLYSYVKNNPTTLIDPDGHDPDNETYFYRITNAMNKGETPVQAQNKNQNAGHSPNNSKLAKTVTRVVAGVSGAVNLVFGGTKAVAGAAATVTAETGVGAAAATYGMVNGGGQASAGYKEMQYAFTGNENDEKAAESAIAHTTITGQLVLHAGGSVSEAAFAGGIENDVPTVMGSSATLVERATTFVNWATQLMNSGAPDSH